LPCVNLVIEFIHERSVMVEQEPQKVLIVQGESGFEYESVRVADPRTGQETDHVLPAEPFIRPSEGE